MLTFGSLLVAKMPFAVTVAAKLLKMKVKRYWLVLVRSGTSLAGCGCLHTGYPAVWTCNQGLTGRVRRRRPLVPGAAGGVSKLQDSK